MLGFYCCLRLCLGDLPSFLVLIAMLSPRQEIREISISDRDSNKKKYILVDWGGLEFMLAFDCCASIADFPLLPVWWLHCSQNRKWGGLLNNSSKSNKTKTEVISYSIQYEKENIWGWWFALSTHALEQERQMNSNSLVEKAVKMQSAAAHSKQSFLSMYNFLKNKLDLLLGVHLFCHSLLHFKISL